MNIPGYIGLLGLLLIAVAALRNFNTTGGKVLFIGSLFYLTGRSISLFHNIHETQRLKVACLALGLLGVTTGFYYMIQEKIRIMQASGESPFTGPFPEKLKPVWVTGVLKDEAENLPDTHEGFWDGNAWYSIHFEDKTYQSGEKPKLRNYKILKVTGWMPIS